MSYETVFSEVVKKVGTLTALAVAIDAPIPTVSSWRKRGIPAAQCKAIEALTGISVKRLRPHDWRAYWPEAGKTKASALTTARVS